MHTFDYEKFVGFLHFMNLVLPEEGEMTVEEDKENSVVKISISEHLFTVQSSYFNMFKVMVEKERFEEFVTILEDENGDIKYIPNLDGEFDNTFLPSLVEDLKEIPDNIKDVIQQRISGIVNIAAFEIKKIANVINNQIDVVARDGNIIKDFDAYLTMDVTYEKGFNIFLCFDKIKPIFEQPGNIEILRTPMSKEDIDLYIGKDNKQIQYSFRLISDAINSLLESKAVSFSKLTKDFAISLINGSVVQHLLAITPVFVSFGGIDNWRLFGDLTPNSEVCHKLLDQEVEHLVKYLKEIPLEEGVEYYAVDVKHFGVYGRNTLNKTILGPLTEQSDELSLRYNDGFLDLFLTRLAMSDNRICFVY